ncbi:MAG TPA: right-handed parallel beta-helix repeat-containing protein [Steroidobacteraceae bacterium]|nr:right-handed parallel beta-helix repeat-containing protein [Steroidobacteraceae bacterium]
MIPSSNRRSSIPVLFSATLTLLLAAGSHAATLRVPTDFSTIQAAIDAAADGDTVSVLPGTYAEQIDFKGKAITVTSRDGPSNTIIDGMGTVTVVIFFSGETETSVLSGLTIQNGRADVGAGVFIGGSSPRIVGNVFRNNSDIDNGWGLAIGGAGEGTPVIDGNLFHSHTCNPNSNLSAVITLVNGQEPRIINNVFRNNQCRGVDLTMVETTLAEVSNNTFVSNRTGIYVDARTGTATHLIRNNIVVGNDVGIDVAFLTGIGTPTPRLLNNLVSGNTVNYQGIDDPTGTNGNLSVAPSFVNQSLNNFQLSAGSPAIDAGEEASAPTPTTDFGGNTRPVDGNADSVARIDIGAFEYAPGTSPPPTPPPTTPPPSNDPGGGGGGGGALSPLELFFYACCLLVTLLRRRNQMA